MLTGGNHMTIDTTRPPLCNANRGRSMKMENKFCVIGDSSANSKSFNRTWFATLDAATEHAAQLLRGRESTKLLVVEVKRQVQPKTDYEVVDVY
jgi:hypothetical protein